MASETKHTPGPWTAYEGWKEGGRVAMHPRWCEVVGGSHSDLSYISISGHFGLPNARLIAAAPEMLAALKEAITFAEGLSPEDVSGGIRNAALRNSLSAAIAKAGATSSGETGMVPVTGKERPMLRPEAASTEARFEPASLHQIADGELLDQAVAFAEMWGTEENWQHVRDAYVAAILRERNQAKATS